MTKLRSNDEITLFDGPLQKSGKYPRLFSLKVVSTGTSCSRKQIFFERGRAGAETNSFGSATLVGRNYSYFIGRNNF